MKAIHPSLVLVTSITDSFFEPVRYFDTRANCPLNSESVQAVNQDRWNETLAVCPKAYRQPRAMALLTERIGE